MSPEQAFCGGASPELAELGLPGVNSIGVWVRDGLRDMRNPPGPKSGHGEVLNTGRDGVGGIGRRRIAGVRRGGRSGGSDVSAKGLGSYCGARASLCNGCAGLCWPAGCLPR